MTAIQYRCLSGHIWPATLIEERADGTLLIEIGTPGHPFRLEHSRIRRGDGPGMVVAEKVEEVCNVERAVKRSGWRGRRRRLSVSP